MRMKKGFTLIELLVVIAIIALLVSILLPSLNKARELAKRAICKTRLKGFGTAFEIYASSHKDSYPYNTGRGDTIRYPTALNNMAVLVLSGQQPGKMFVCPSVTEDDPLIVEELSSTDPTTLIVDEDGDQIDENRISYSYQAAMLEDVTTYLGNGVKPNAQGGLAIMSDKTPELNDTRGNYNVAVNWAGTVSESQRERAISQNHKGDIFNLLFRDSHVGDDRRGDAGLANEDGDPDNVFTTSGSEDDSSPSGTYDLDGVEHYCVDDSMLISNEGN